jgi:membrane protein implicated in regulation of membrane protease activity
VLSKPIGLMLTIAGLVLAVWFVQMLLVPGPAPLQVFIVAAISFAMLSVGIRYTLKNSKKKQAKKKEGSGT